MAGLAYSLRQDLLRTLRRAAVGFGPLPVQPGAAQAMAVDLIRQGHPAVAQRHLLNDGLQHRDAICIRPDAADAQRLENRREQALPAWSRSVRACAAA